MADCVEEDCEYSTLHVVPCVAIVYLPQSPQRICDAIRHPCQPFSPFAIRRHTSPFVHPKLILSAAVCLARRGRFSPPAAARPPPVAATLAGRRAWFFHHAEICFTTSLIPAFSPRRRRIVRRLFEKPATGLAGWSTEKTKTCKGYSFSWGRRPG